MSKTMEKHIEWYMHTKIERTIVNLEKHHMQGIYVESREKLWETLDGLIDDDTTLGVGDSWTFSELGVIEYIRNRQVNFYDKYAPNLTSADKKAIYRKNFSADTFLTSSNAVTESGELVNIDGNGSRVAPMIYGPDQVIVIVGTNKIVRDLDEAKRRVRQYAAPIDAKRLGKNTPCTKVGYCMDCKHEERICNSFVTIANQFDKNRIKVLILLENLGY